MQPPRKCRSIRAAGLGYRRLVSPRFAPAALSSLYLIELAGLLIFVALLTVTPRVAAEPADANPILRMETHLGAIELELYADLAPITVRNFLRHVANNFYPGAAFYRVVHAKNQAGQTIPIEIIQGGRGISAAPSNIPPIQLESTQRTGLSHIAGAISMARTAPNSATSEFFICVTDQPELDYGGKRYADGLGFAVFGQVKQGMDIVKKIQQQETILPIAGIEDYAAGQMLLKPVAIEQFRLLNNNNQTSSKHRN